MCKRGASREKNLQHHRGSIFEISLEKGKHMKIFDEYGGKSSALNYTLLYKGSYFVLCMRWMQTFQSQYNHYSYFTCNFMLSLNFSLYELRKERRVCGQRLIFMFIFMYFIYYTYEKDVFLSLEWQVKYRDIPIYFLWINFTCFQHIA